MSQVKFGYSHTDHMLDIDYKENSGWDTPHIKPF
jgi:hypothetical protein